MNKLTLIIVAVLIFGGYATVSAEETRGVMCTQEARQCPDGSYVGRTGPNCEFSACPGKKQEGQRPLQNVKNKLEEQKENRIENRNEMRERVASSTAKRIEKRFENMSKRYLSTIEREEKIANKLVVRIEKIKLEGGNTADAEKLVAEAKEHLAEARTAYEILKTSSTNADNATTTPKEAVNQMRNSVKVIETHLREAHKSLQKTVGALRGVSQLRNATSTKEN